MILFYHVLNSIRIKLYHGWVKYETQKFSEDSVFYGETKGLV